MSLTVTLRLCVCCRLDSIRSRRVSVWYLTQEDLGFLRVTATQPPSQHNQTLFSRTQRLRVFYQWTNSVTAQRCWATASTGKLRAPSSARPCRWASIRGRSVFESPQTSVSGRFILQGEYGHLSLQHGSEIPILFLHSAKIYAFWWRGNVTRNYKICFHVSGFERDPCFRDSSKLTF